MKIRSGQYALGMALALIALWVGPLSAQDSPATSTTVRPANPDQIYSSAWNETIHFLMGGDPKDALKRVSATLEQLPKAPGLYLLRAAVEAHELQWKAVADDCSEAEALNLMPQLRGFAASMLALSPNAMDHQNAIRNAVIAIGAEGSGRYFDMNLTAGVIALRRLQSPEEFLKTLQSAALDGAHRGQAISAYLASIEEPERFFQMMKMGSFGIDVSFPPIHMNVSQLLDQAVQTFGDQPMLDVDRIDDDLLQGHNEMAVDYGRQHLKLHPAAEELRNALRVAEARWAMQLLETGDADGAASALDVPVPGHPDRPEIAILRARILSAQGQYKPALAELVQASLQSQPTGAADDGLYHNLMSFLLTTPSAELQSQDILYWQGLVAFEAGDYSTAASAMQYSDQVTKWVDPKADYVLAISQERSGQRDAARASWKRMLDHSRYTVYQGFALAGLRRTGGNATAESRESFNLIEGNLTSIHCRDGKPYGVTILNGSVEYPARVTESLLIRGQVPHACGPLVRPIWVSGLVRPVEADMPLYIGVATVLNPNPYHMSTTYHHAAEGRPRRPRAGVKKH